MPSFHASTLLAVLCLTACHHVAPPVEPAELTTPDGAQHILTILAVGDLEASLAFYSQAFGWPLRVDAPVFKELELPDGRGLGLYARPAFAHNTGGHEPTPLPPGAISGTELYFHVPDLGQAVADLEAAGARLLSARALRPWGDEAAYYADPDGNVLVVATTAAE